MYPGKSFRNLLPYDLEINSRNSFMTAVAFQDGLANQDFQRTRKAVDEFILKIPEKNLIFPFPKYCIFSVTAKKCYVGLRHTCEKKELKFY